LLFDIVHFKYFGLKNETIIYVVFAFIGRYYLDNVDLMTQSILPTIFIHVVFNMPAIKFLRYRRKKQYVTNNTENR